MKYPTPISTDGISSVRCSRPIAKLAEVCSVNVPLAKIAALLSAARDALTPMLDKIIPKKIRRIKDLLFQNLELEFLNDKLCIHFDKGSNRMRSGTRFLACLLSVAGFGLTGCTHTPPNEYHAAAQTGTIAALESAKSTGADINGHGDSKNTPLHIAAEFDNVQAIQWLLQNGAVVDSLNSDLSTPLHLAAKSNHP